jgi:hypothetical protein
LLSLGVKTLSIDPQFFFPANQKRSNEISSSSYGNGKKTLGVPRPGTVSGLFKPPVVSKNSEVQPDVLAPPSSGAPITNDRLKHLVSILSRLRFFPNCFRTNFYRRISDK